MTRFLFWDLVGGLLASWLLAGVLDKGGVSGCSYPSPMPFL